ncbi:accessory gene regulator ArgB-like protein [Desulforamulus aquiferis]|uniref:Accessory gene regulator B family protein n=1 Tax=Desulforamulus aquiferis TaxID=1397668 RepID=A0AAW7ZGM4_9FIRM|nr:accessory gene regulator B family protein [Desulforamulus aquiferis]MDO7788852.1 accessory gene regulator B family protein [Desulforamulus aquiferis]
MLQNLMVNYLKKNLVLSRDQEEIVIFAIKLIESTIYSIGSIVLASLILGNLNETIIVLIAAAAMRLASGGAHCTTALHCTLAGTLIFPTLGFIPKYYHIESSMILIIPIIISFVFILKYAPAESPGKPLTSKKYIKKMYRISIIISLIITALAMYLLPLRGYISVALVTGLFWQSLTITPFGYKIISYLDRIIFNIVRR